MSCGEKAGKARSVIERFCETLSGLLLYYEMSAPAATEIVTVQHPDRNAERDVNSEKYDSELILGESSHG